MCSLSVGSPTAAQQRPGSPAIPGSLCPGTGRTVKRQALSGAVDVNMLEEILDGTSNQIPKSMTMICCTQTLGSRVLYSIAAAVELLLQYT